MGELIFCDFAGCVYITLLHSVPVDQMHFKILFNYLTKVMYVDVLQKVILRLTCNNWQMLLMH